MDTTHPSIRLFLASCFDWYRHRPVVEQHERFTGQRLGVDMAIVACDPDINGLGRVGAA
jgi:hypothetical protein